MYANVALLVKWADFASRTTQYSMNTDYILFCITAFKDALNVSRGEGGSKPKAVRALFEETNSPMIARDCRWLLVSKQEREKGKKERGREN